MFNFQQKIMRHEEMKKMAGTALGMQMLDLTKTSCNYFKYVQSMK